MQKLLLKNAEVVTLNQKAEIGSILIEDAKISSLSTSESTETKIDLTDCIVFAGFIDAHIHGAVGVDVNMADADDLYKMAKFLAENGTTAWLPTFVPDADETYRKVISEIEKIIEIQANEPIAQIVGVHYEGIFANEKMCGALRPEFFKTFTGNELDDLPELKSGVHLTTFAPEIEGGIELVKELKKQNWIPSIGHTKADIRTLENAFEAGAKHLTHFFNAMTGLHHRDVGVAGWALTKDEVTFDIIADGVHVAPQILKFAVQSKSTDKVSLISDAVLPTGLGDGNFEIWGEKVSVVSGKTQNERGSIAGSVITMRDGVKMMLSLGFSQCEVSKMASGNPAKLLGLEKTHGSIEIGKRADLIALDKVGNVRLTIIGGKIVFNNTKSGK
ncbi:N-acetylglucosamine-6-phosphate deacetylase [soil metagenome]